MVFSATFLEKLPLPGGLLLETGTFNGSGVTTGTITADVTQDPQIADILAWGASDDADIAVICATDIAPNKLKLTFGSGDTGKYWFIGKAR